MPPPNHVDFQQPGPSHSSPVLSSTPMGSIYDESNPRRSLRIKENLKKLALLKDIKKISNTCRSLKENKSKLSTREYSTIASEESLSSNPGGNQKVVYNDIMRLLRDTKEKLDDCSDIEEISEYRISLTGTHDALILSISTLQDNTFVPSEILTELDEYLDLCSAFFLLYETCHSIHSYRKNEESRENLNGRSLICEKLNSMTPSMENWEFSEDNIARRNLLGEETTSLELREMGLLSYRGPNNEEQSCTSSESSESETRCGFLKRLISRI